MHKALYRQYRPLDFSDVFGQDTIVKTLQNSIKNNSYSHAYMFFGPRGTGKTSISKIFARALNCLEPKDGNACGKCKNCQNSYQKECVDIIEIDAASNNGVDEIRELRNKVSLVPAELKYKVYIIDEVHMLSIGAFNALLKTLEEPPEHVVFILATTDPQKVPETIISRCQCFSFKRIALEKIIENLKKICKSEKISIDDCVLEEIAYFSDGGMRDALSTLDQLNSYCDKHITLEDFAEVNGTLTNNELQKLYENIFECNYNDVLISLKKYNDDGKNIITIFDSLMRFLRKIIVEYYLHNSSCAYDVEKIHRLVILINEKMIDVKKSSNPNIYIEMILLEFMNNLKVNSKQINLSETNSNTSKVLKIDQQNDNNKEDTKAIFSSNFKEEEKVSTTENEEKNVGEKVEKSPKKEKIIHNEDSREIKNLDEIIEVRVNNILATANKKILLDEISGLEKFNDYTFDTEIGYLVCSILDANVRAASDNGIILSYEYDSIVKQNLSTINKMIEVYNKIKGSNKTIAIISDKKWEEVKNKYIQDIKNGVTLTVVEEPKEIFIEQENNDIIDSEAIKLFGDIVEIN